MNLFKDKSLLNAYYQLNTVLKTRGTTISHSEIVPALMELERETH